MADPYLIGSIGGSLLSGIFGRSRQKEDARMQTEFAQKGLGWRIEDGKKHGLHPLASAGATGATFQPVGGNPIGDAAADIGRTLGSAPGRKQNAKAAAKELDLLDAQIAESRSRTMLNQANHRRASYGPMPLVSGNGNQLEAFDKSAHDGRPRGVRIEPEGDLPATQTVSLGSKTARGPNPEAFEVGLSELIAGAMIYGPQWLAQHANDWKNDYNQRIAEKGNATKAEIEAALGRPMIKAELEHWKRHGNLPASRFERRSK